MTVVFPDGLIILVPAGILQAGSLAYFPDGERYAVIQVTLTAVGTIRVEGKKWSEWADGHSRRPARAQFTVSPDEIIPVVQPPLVA